MKDVMMLGDQLRIDRTSRLLHHERLNAFSAALDCEGCPHGYGMYVCMYGAYNEKIKAPLDCVDFKWRINISQLLQCRLKGHIPRQTSGSLKLL